MWAKYGRKEWLELVRALLVQGRGTRACQDQQLGQHAVIGLTRNGDAVVRWYRDLHEEGKEREECRVVSVVVVRVRVGASGEVVAGKVERKP